MFGRLAAWYAGIFCHVVTWFVALFPSRTIGVYEQFSGKEPCPNLGAVRIKFHRYIQLSFIVSCKLRGRWCMELAARGGIWGGTIKAFKRHLDQMWQMVPA